MFTRQVSIAAAILCMGLCVRASGASLVPTPTSVTLNANAGTTAVVSTTVSVTASSGALNFTAAVTTQSGGSWLSVTPTSGATPKTLTVNGNPTGLSAGSYVGTITLTCTSGSSCSPVAIAVTFSIQGVVLTATPDPVPVTVTQGLTQTANVALMGLASVSVSVGSGASWLTAPASATSPGNLTLTVMNTAILPTGSQTGSVILQCVNGTRCLSVTVTVSLTVAPAGITVSSSVSSTCTDPNFPVGLGFIVNQSQQACTGSITVKSTAGAVPFTYSSTTQSGGAWLTVTPSCAQMPCTGTATTQGTTLNVTANSGFLAQLSVPYKGVITIAGGGTTITVNVQLTLQGQQILAAPLTVPITVLQGGVSSSVQVKLTIPSGYNVNPVPKDSYVLVDTTMLGSNILNIGINAGSLAAGSQLSAVDVQCKPQTTCFDAYVVVQATVNPRPALNVNPASLTIPVSAGTVSQSKSVNITTSDMSKQSWSANAPNWVTVSPSSGSTSGNASVVSVAIDAHSLQPGTQMGTVTFSCANPSSCTSTSVSVTASVSAPATLSVNPASISFAAYQGRANPPPKAVTISASDGSAVPFSVSGAPTWLGVSALTGTTGQSSGTLTLTPTIGSLPANGATATLSIMPGNGSPAISLNVSATLTPFTISANPNPLTIPVITGQAQMASFFVGTVDSAPATVNVAASGSPALSVSSSVVAAPALVSVTVNAAGVIPGTYPANITLTCASSNPCAALPVAVQIDVQSSSSPSITQNGIVPIYSAATTIESGEWVSIFGNNLASTSISNMTFPFPMSLGGTSVTIDGKLAFLWSVGPGQINLQAPDDTATGTVPVMVTTANGTANATVTLAPFAPSFSLLDTTHVAAIVLRPDGSGTQGTYDILGPTGTSLGYATVAARPGDAVVLYGVGFGPTNPAVPAGQAPPAGGATAVTLPVITIGGAPVNVSFAGITEVGLYQINITVPNNVSSGDQPLLGMAGGVQTQAKVVFAIQ